MTLINNIYNDWLLEKQNIVLYINNYLTNKLHNTQNINSFPTNFNCKEIWEIVYGDLIEYNNIYYKLFDEMIDRWIKTYIVKLNKRKKKELVDKYILYAYDYYNNELLEKVEEYVYMTKFNIKLEINLMNKICKGIIYYIIHK
tara:strand:+ start:2746 stop:3174 length:429 start_codon:yes stop_codon:yes gene_type:complete